MYDGKVKLILKYLGFLVNEYNLKFSFQSFSKCGQFYGPIDYYSFYNENGCFTIQNVVQRGEWGLFKSKEFSTNQYDLALSEIDQRKYFKKSYLTARGWLKALSEIIRDDIVNTKSFFSIKLN